MSKKDSRSRSSVENREEAQSNSTYLPLADRSGGGDGCNRCRSLWPEKKEPEAPSLVSSPRAVPSINGSDQWNIVNFGNCITLIRLPDHNLGNTTTAAGSMPSSDLTSYLLSPRNTSSIICFVCSSRQWKLRMTASALCSQLWAFAHLSSTYRLSSVTNLFSVCSFNSYTEFLEVAIFECLWLSWEAPPSMIEDSLSLLFSLTPIKSAQKREQFNWNKICGWWCNNRNNESITRGNKQRENIDTEQATDCPAAKKSLLPAFTGKWPRHNNWLLCAQSG